RVGGSPAASIPLTQIALRGPRSYGDNRFDIGFISHHHRTYTRSEKLILRANILFTSQTYPPQEYKFMSKRYTGFFSCVTVAGFAMMCLTQNVQAQPKYAITDLGTLGGTYSLGQGINSSGQTVGNAYTTGDVAPHGFRTAANSAIKPTDDLSTLGGSYSVAQ